VLDTPVEYEPGPCHANTLVITVIVREYKRYMSHLLTLTNYPLHAVNTPDLIGFAREKSE